LLRQYASEQDFELVREFVDVDTAKRAGRAGFGMMLGFFKKNAAKCRVLLVEKTDRLYRNLKVYVVLDDFDLDSIPSRKDRRSPAIRVRRRSQCTVSKS
jgi:site-specific DNA recombinase